ERVLVTGGAGFIGSHLVEALIARGATVRVLDGLDPQVHGPGAVEPKLLPKTVEFIHGSVADPGAVDRALAEAPVVVPLAAMVGVGQSMYAIGAYVAGNAHGTAVLLDRIVNGGHAVRRLVVASSMSIYGEGRYRCAACGLVAPRPRPAAQLDARDWEMRCPTCAAAGLAVRTDEGNPPAPTPGYSRALQEALAPHVELATVPLHPGRLNPLALVAAGARLSAHDVAHVQHTYSFFGVDQLTYTLLVRLLWSRIRAPLVVTAHTV